MRWIAICAVLVIGGLAVATQVFAHAEYERSTPARDEVVAESPEQLDIYYTQDVRKIEGANTITVLDDGASKVNNDDGIVDDDDRTHVFTALPPNLPPGRYIVQWKTLSDLDDDDDSGAFCFYVAVEPSAAQADECAAFDAEEDEPTAAPPSEEPTEADGEATPTTAGPAPTTSPPPDGTDGDDDGGLSSGVIVAIVLGVIVVVVAVGAAAYWLRRS
ncbi:MAG: copper resistance protein CopC [Dehalococcoidia bacterium]